MLKGYVQCVICMKQQTKMKVCYKYMILLTIRAHLTRNLLWNFKPSYQQKTGTSWNKNQEVLRAWSNRGSFFFLQNKNRLHYAPVVQFPFGQPSHQSFCRNTWLCRGSWLRLPSISSGKVIVGFWTKMIGRLGRTFLELFFSICSSKLEASHTCLQKLQLFLKMDVTASTLFIFRVFRSKLGVVDS